MPYFDSVDFMQPNKCITMCTILHQSFFIVKRNINRICKIVDIKRTEIMYSLNVSKTRFSQFKRQITIRAHLYSGIPCCLKVKLAGWHLHLVIDITLLLIQINPRLPRLPWLLFSGGWPGSVPNSLFMALPQAWLGDVTNCLCCLMKARCAQPSGLTGEI